MPEAVIVATARSPIGRANKGSLTTLRPDDMSAQIVKALMAKVPQVQASDVDDLMMGIGQPAGEGGFNIARVVAVLAGLDDVPGVTVNRYCSSSLQTIRMAFHAIKAGEGDCFIAAGVETVSRYAAGASDTAPNPIFKPSGERTKPACAGRPGHVDPAGRACPTSTSPWVRPPRTSSRSRASPARRWTLRRALAEPGVRARRQRLLRATRSPR